MAVVSCLRVRMERSTRAACSPGGEVCSEIPRDPRGAASEVLIFSQSSWSVWTYAPRGAWRCAVYVLAMTWWRALKTVGVDSDAAPTMDRCPVNSRRLQ